MSIRASEDINTPSRFSCATFCLVGCRAFWPRKLTDSSELIVELHEETGLDKHAPALVTLHNMHYWLHPQQNTLHSSHSAQWEPFCFNVWIIALSRPSLTKVAGNYSPPLGLHRQRTNNQGGWGSGDNIERPLPVLLVLEGPGQGLNQQMYWVSAVISFCVFTIPPCSMVWYLVSQSGK